MQESCDDADEAKLPLQGDPEAFRQAGLFKGEIWMAGNFDDPLPDEVLLLFHAGHPDDPLDEPRAR